MKLGVIVAVCIAWVGYGAAAETAARPAGDTNRVAVLIKQIAEGNFKMRSAAAAELATFPRSALPILRARANTEDPELSVRIREIIGIIESDPLRIPTACYIFEKDSDETGEARAKSAARLAEWREKAIMAAGNTNATPATAGATSGAFAQSFVPHCKEIQAIEVCVYPVREGENWLRLDVCEDKDGRPDARVLARCLVRRDDNGAAVHGSHTIFGFPGLTVQPDRKYWLCFTEYRKGEASSCVNYQMSMDTRYSEGDLLSPGSGRLTDRDVLFRILTSCGPVPRMREATDAERKTIPADAFGDVAGWTQGAE